MRITLLGHASLLVQSKKTNVLVDPVFFDPFEDDMISCPKRAVYLDLLPLIHAVVISHNHDDHCDPRSLRCIPRTVPVLCPQDRRLVAKLRSLGFDTVRVVECFRPQRIRDLDLIPTRAVDEREVGLVFRSEGIAVWNQVDTAATQHVCAELYEVLGTMPDALLCPYNPLLEHVEYWTEEVSFPLARYERLLESAIASQAKVVVPSSSGQRHPDDSSWQNRREFPVSRERFLRDLSAVAPEIRGVLLNPGDTLVLEPGEPVRVEPSNFATTLAHDDHLTAFAPESVACPPLVDENLFGFREELIVAFVDELLGVALPQALEVTLTPKLVGPLRHLWDRRAIVQIEVVLPNSERVYHVAEWHPRIRVVSRAHPDPDYVWHYVGSEIYAEAQGQEVEDDSIHIRRRRSVTTKSESTPPASGNGERVFRFSTLDPYRLNNLDPQFVVDHDLCWDPLSFLETALRKALERKAGRG